MPTVVLYFVYCVSAIFNGYTVKKSVNCTPKDHCAEDKAVITFDTNLLASQLLLRSLVS